MDGTRDEPVAFQRAQRQGQHALRDAADLPLDLAEPLGAGAEEVDDQHRPLVADAGEDAADGAAVAGKRRVPWCQECASLREPAAVSNVVLVSNRNHREQEPPMPKIAVIVGSLRRDSINRKLAEALAGLAKPKAEFVFSKIDDLPLFSQDLEPSPPAAVTRLKGEIEAAHGVLIVT